MNLLLTETNKCGCGRDIRYSTSCGRGSCNKYQRCLSYEEQEELIKVLSSKVVIYEHNLHKIVRVNAMDYEYKTWAKEALESFKED